MVLLSMRLFQQEFWSRPDNMNENFQILMVGGKRYWMIPQLDGSVQVVEIKSEDSVKLPTPVA